MAGKAGHRGFGYLRRLPSKRWQASYVGPDLARHCAPKTFGARMDAEGWLAAERRLIDQEAWTAPRTRSRRAQGMSLADYAPDAIVRRRTRGRPLKPSTIALYETYLRRIILPALGDVPMNTITAAQIASWYDDLPADQETARAHAYALVKSLFDQAIQERRITNANPCTIKGAGVTRRKREIRPATLEELALIVEAAPERLRLMFLLCAWCGLRFGEVGELRRSDIDLAAGVLHVRRGFVRVKGQDVTGTPKSEAGARAVAIPPHLFPAITEHLAEHTQPKASSLVFPHHSGTDEHWQHGTVYQHWMHARDAAGRPDLRLHDLRHTAAVMAAQTGATLAELMARLGHSTPQAALRYQHAAAGRDAQIAQALSRMATGQK